MVLLHTSATFVLTPIATSIENSLSTTTAQQGICHAHPLTGLYTSSLASRLERRKDCTPPPQTPPLGADLQEERGGRRRRHAVAFPNRRFRCCQSSTGGVTGSSLPFMDGHKTCLYMEHLGLNRARSTRREGPEFTDRTGV